MMNGHYNRPAAQGREPADDKCPAVSRPNAYALSRLYPQTIKLQSQRFNFPPKRSVIHRAAGINYGRAIRPLHCGTGQCFKYIHFFKNSSR